jgi:hypothetical protein
MGSPSTSSTCAPATCSPSTRGQTGTWSASGKWGDSRGGPAESSDGKGAAAHLQMRMLTRQSIITALGALSTHGFIRAASLGGSDATGRADELSDVDLVLFVTPGHVEQTAQAVDELLRTLSPINIHWRLPMPTWHGFHQAFYQLVDAPEHLMIDWLVVEVDQPHPWFEVERHGVAKPLFDKDGLLRQTHVDRAAIDAAIRKRVDEIRKKCALFRHMGAKNATRGLPIDACHFYHSLALRPLIDMLRITHAPDRHDYGLRYLRDDLPAQEYQTVKRLCYPHSAADIPAFTAEITQMMEALFARWDAAHPSVAAAV